MLLLQTLDEADRKKVLSLRIFLNGFVFFKNLGFFEHFLSFSHWFQLKLECLAQRILTRKLRKMRHREGERFFPL